MKLNAKATAISIWQSMKSPLVRQISLVVFLCIIVIEIATLVISYYSERDRLLTRIDQSLELVLPIFESSDDFSVFDTLLVSQDEQAAHPLIGLVIMAKNGKAYYLSGDTDGLRDGYNAVSRGKRFNSRTGVYETYVITYDGDHAKTHAWFRVDARRVNKELQEYVWRIIQLVLQVSLFVTVGCVLALSPILIQPLLDLRQQMLGTRTNGLGSFKAPLKSLLRKDEIGDVYREFDHMQSALIESENTNQAISARFQDFADLGADCFWEVDRSQRFVFLAGGVRSLFGYDVEQILGQRLQKLSTRKDFPFPCSVELAKSLADSSLWEGALEFPDNPDLEKTVRIVGKKLYRSDGSFIGMRGTVTNTTVATKLAQDLNHLASHDALTGLYNRRLFDELADEAMQSFQSKAESFCVCLLDLDRFKLINDSCGHAAGDSLLNHLSTIITNEVRKQDIACRYGGDEFALILKNCELDDGYRICESIRLAIADIRFQWEEQSYDIGVSIGIAEASDEFEQASDVMLAADACCYKAKNNGRNQVQVYNSTDAELYESEIDAQWMAKITAGLEQDSFSLFQQRIQTLEKDAGRRVHFEVLLRMVDEDGRIYLPNSFLPAAERYGLMVRVDMWVVKQVLNWLVEAEPPGDVELLLHVNLSAVAALDEEFQVFLINAIEQADVNPSHLCFEFKETLVAQKLASMPAFMQELQALGCKIALDGFGKGVSILGYIRMLPVDYIKIAGSFVRDLEQSTLDQIMVKCIIDVAKSLKIRTVAECIEKDATLTQLGDLGVDMVQGFLVSEPETLKDMHFYLEEMDVLKNSDSQKKAG